MSQMAQAGIAFCDAHRGATSKTLACCEKLLNPGRGINGGNSKT
jgi:hypothetical protein